MDHFCSFGRTGLAVIRSDSWSLIPWLVWPYAQLLLFLAVKEGMGSSTVGLMALIRQSLGMVSSFTTLVVITS